MSIYLIDHMARHVPILPIQVTPPPMRTTTMSWERKLLESTATILISTAVASFSLGFLAGQHTERRAQADTWTGAYNAGFQSANLMNGMNARSMQAQQEQEQ